MYYDFCPHCGQTLEIEQIPGRMLVCPHCNESVEITLDPSGGDQQEYVEDCEICCNPWSVTVHFGADGKAEVEVVALDD